MKHISDIPSNIIDYDIEIYERLSAHDLQNSFMPEAERKYINGLVRYFKPNNILELGVAYGCGSIVILNAISDFPESMLYSVDILRTFRGDQIIGFVAIEKFPESKQWNLFTGKDPSEIINSFESNLKFDFVIIDTMHFHPVETLNFLSVFPFLTEDAIVVIQDIGLHAMCLNTNNAGRLPYQPYCDFPRTTLAPKLLFDTIVADKHILPIQSYSEKDITEWNIIYSNIGALQITKDTKKYLSNVFSMLEFPWGIIPEKMKFISDLLYKHYDEKLYRIFQYSYTKNVFLINNNYITYNKHGGCDGITPSFNKKPLFMNAWITTLNNEILSSKHGVILYGAGLNAARFIVHCIRDNIELNILCIIDADVRKQGGQLLGVSIAAPENLINYDKETCIIVTPEKFCLAITDKIHEFGFNNILYYHIWNSQIIEFANEKNKFIECNYNELNAQLEENFSDIAFVKSNLLHDDRSIAVYNAKIDSNFKGNHIPLEAMHERNQYFPKDIISLSDHEVFIDCGSFDGGTIYDFINRVNQYSYIYSFEPDPWQYIITDLSIKTNPIDRCEIFNLGVYSSEGKFNFSSRNFGASRVVDDGDLEVSITTLDTFFIDKPNKPTFIKMDIEGAELEALKGAYNTIKLYHPKLAISVYHVNSHIWEIPFWIITNFPEYKIYLRQHLNINETICYAI